MTDQLPEVRLFGGPAEPGGAPRAITTIEQWFDYAPPRGGREQWVPLRSAYELARAWCGGQAGIAAPEPFVRMLTAHPLLDDLQLSAGYAEHRTPLRGEGRGPRVHDLLLIGSGREGRVVVGVEGKADEDFDRPLGARWEEAQRKRAARIATNWPERLERLVPALFGVQATTVGGDLNPELADIPYQLLSALAGTLIEAEERQASHAVLVVHVFTSSATKPELVERNRKGFAQFVERIGKVPATAVSDGELYGPFSVPGGDRTRIPSEIPILLGELTTAVSLDRENR